MNGDLLKHTIAVAAGYLAAKLVLRASGVAR